MIGEEKIKVRRGGKSFLEEERFQWVFKDEDMFIRKSRRVKDMLAAKTSLYRVTEMRC